MNIEDPKLSDEQFMSAAEKQKVLRAWKRFLKGGCTKSQFTEDLYHHLSQHCSFIAHFNRHGFYDFYFDGPSPDVLRFLDQFDPNQPGISAEYGTTHWLSSHSTGADLNHAMRKTAWPHVQTLRKKFAERIRQRDIGAASRVLARYGLTVVSSSTPTVTSDLAAEMPRNRPSSDPVQPRLFG